MGLWSASLMMTRYWVKWPGYCEAANHFFSNSSK
jgi:hypothetical protein